jgi:hypothetical protein
VVQKHQFTVKAIWYNNYGGAFGTFTYDITSIVMTFNKMVWKESLEEEGCGFSYCVLLYIVIKWEDFLQWADKMFLKYAARAMDSIQCKLEVLLNVLERLMETLAARPW